MKKVAVYCRQSLKKEDSLSIPKQEEDCRNSLPEQEKDLVVVYTDQKSGKNTDREGFSNMMEEIKAGHISKVVVWKLDRISRNLADFCEMYNTFEEYGTSFYSVNDNFDTSQMTGMFMLKMVMMFAEMERKNTQMRVKSNFYGRIRDGRWACGSAPYGYRNAKMNRISTLVPEDNKLEAVKACFYKYAHSPNTSLGQLARWLSENGYKSLRENGGWDSTTVMRMLKTPSYAVADERLKKYFITKGMTILNEDSWTGETSCQLVGRTQTIVKNGKEQRGKVDSDKQTVYPTNFKGIVDSKTYIMVQERLEQNQQFKRANAPSSLQELAGLLKCADCGYAVKANSVSPKNGRPYLVCHGRSVLKICNNSFAGVRFEDIQKKVGNEIQKKLDTIALEVLDGEKSNLERKKKIEECEKRLDSLLMMMPDNKKAAERVSKKMDEIQSEIDKLTLDEFMDTRTTERLRIRNHLPLMYERFTTEEKKSMCQQLIEKILLSHTGDIEIIWKE
jgi:Site-specific recombinases, DNA invertase Pin homologs